MDPAGSPFRILVLCSGNVCRSPMLKVLLGHALDEIGVPAVVTSSGFLTTDRPASPEVVELLRDRGLDGRAHRSRLTTADMLAEADLVVAMAAEHLRNAVVLGPDVFARTFLLKELGRAIDAHGPRRAGETVADYLARAFPERTMQDYLRLDPDLEVADPMGRRMKFYKGTAAELEALTSQLVRGLWPDQAARTADPTPRAG